MRSALLVASLLGALVAPAAAAPREVVIASEVLRARGAALPGEAELFVRRLEAVAGLPAKSLAPRTFTDPREALAYLKKAKPAYAILPQHQYVAARKELGLAVVGGVVGLEGDERYFWGVSRVDAPAYDHIETRPGLTLIGTEIDDLPWLSNVIFETNVKAEKHFKLKSAPTSADAVMAVAAKQADVALVYESEIRNLGPRLTKGGDLVQVYASAPMPPPPLVVLRKAARPAPAAEIKKLVAGLKKVCEGDGAGTCARLGILRMEPAADRDYQNLVRKYEM